MSRSSLKAGPTLNLPVAAAAVLCLCMIGGAEVGQPVRAVAAESQALASLVTRFAEAARQVRPGVVVIQPKKAPLRTPDVFAADATWHQHTTATHLPPLRAALLNLPPPFIA